MSSQKVSRVAVAALGLTALGLAAGDARAAVFTLEDGRVTQSIPSKSIGAQAPFVDIVAPDAPSEGGIDLFATTDDAAPFISTGEFDAFVINASGDITAFADPGVDPSKGAAIEEISPPIAPGETIRIEFEMTAVFDGRLSYNSFEFTAGLDPVFRGGYTEELFADENDGGEFVSGEPLTISLETEAAQLGGYGVWDVFGFLNWEPDDLKALSLQRVLEFDLSVSVEVVPTPGATALLALAGGALVTRRRR